MRYIDVDNFLKYFEDIESVDFKSKLLIQFSNYFTSPTENFYQVFRMLDIFRGDDVQNFPMSTQLRFLNPICHTLMPADKEVCDFVTTILTNYMMVSQSTNNLTSEFLSDLDLIISEQEARKQERRKKIIKLNNKDK